MANKTRDIGERDAAAPPPPPHSPALNARSLALSALLGTHPPALPTRALVALAELFGIAGGTMRTAISRMAAAGEIVSDDGWHRLAGRLLDRQRSQDLGRTSPPPSWDGRWHTVVAADDRRDLHTRRRFRAVLADHRFGELRPDIWMRPANLPAPTGLEGMLVVSGELDPGTTGGVDELAARLWDLPAIAARAADLRDDVRRAIATSDPDSAADVPTTFLVAADVLRFLRSEPMLPPRLTPARWPVDPLRDEYRDLETRLQRALRDFLRAHRDRPAGAGPRERDARIFAGESHEA